MDTETPAPAAPAVTLVRRREKLEVAVDLDVTGFGPMGMGGGYPLTLEAVSVTAIQDDDRRFVSLHARGKNQWGVAQSGCWSLPRPTTPPTYDSQTPYVGLITRLPRQLLDAVEAAAGIRFADYVAPAEG